MESIQNIKRRIDSISSTRQITRSMRLVATSKIQRARERMENNREFMNESVGIAVSVAEGLAGSNHPYIKPRQGLPAAVIVISADRGLCGGYNIGVCKEAHQLLRRLGGEVKIVTVGTKCREYFNRRRGKSVAKFYIGVSENPFFEDAGEIAQLVLGWYNKGEVGSVHIVYTSFENVLTHVPKAFQLLPLSSGESGGPAKGLTRFEPSDSALLQQAVPFYVSSFVYGAMLESSVCEQSARMVSMDTAVNNSDEMIEDLTLLYNQARQSAITEELIDIISGANAVIGKKS